MRKVLCLLISLSIVLTIPLIAWAQRVPDAALAVNNPDKYAWDLFAALNLPAQEGTRGIADPSKEVGDAGARVWETWKLTTPEGSDVFLPDGAKPAPWDEVPPQITGGHQRKILSPRKFIFSSQDIEGRAPKTFMSQFAGRQLNDGQESRINRPGFETIVQEGLYSIDGQERFRATGRVLEFPADTIAVKAQWRVFTQDEISQGIQSRFYTSEDQNGEIIGLTGFHITSKVLPNWFWATFEQVDNPPPEIADRDRYTTIRYPSATVFAQHRLRNVPDSLKGTVWQYYVLRGTQIDFVDQYGSPTILGNTQLEQGMQTSASCITCHSRATIGDRVDNIFVNGRQLYPPTTSFFPGGSVYGDGSNRLTVDPTVVFWRQDPQASKTTLIPIATSANGVPDPNWFMNPGTGQFRYTQLGFLWEFIFAQREK